MRHSPQLTYPLRWEAYQAIKDESKDLDGSQAASLPLPDRKIFVDPAIQAAFFREVREGYRLGGDGPAQDDLIIHRNWGISLGEISNRIDLWHGDLDQNVPLNQIMFLDRELPNSRLNVVRNQAHLFLLTHWEVVLKKLVGES